MKGSFTNHRLRTTEVDDISEYKLDIIYLTVLMHAHRKGIRALHLLTYMHVRARAHTYTHDSTHSWLKSPKKNSG